MPFLSINGWAQPLQSASHGFAEIGSADRAYSGKLRRVRRGIKRTISVQTRPMSYERCIATEGMLRGDGEYWSYDVDAYGLKGRPPVSSTNYAVFDAAQAKFGAAALWAHEALTNLFTANVRTGTDTLNNTSGFTATGAGVLTSDTTQFVSGARSLKIACVAGGGIDGALAAAAVTGSSTYTFSVYVKASGAATYYIEIRDNIGGGFTGASIAVTTSWQRFSVTRTVGASATSVNCTLSEHSSLTGGNLFADQWQCELGSTATIWVDGTTPALALSYDISKYLNQGAVAASMNAWAKSPVVGGHLFKLTDDGTRYVKLHYNAANTMRVTVLNGSSQTLDYTWSTPTTYAMWSLVAWDQPYGSRNTIELYKDGILVAESDSISVPPIDEMELLYVGNNTGVTPWGGYVDDVSFMPYAMTLGQTAGYASMTAGLAMPRLYCTGDLVEGTSQEFVASNIRTDFIGGRLNADDGYVGNLGRMSFTLTEV